MKASVYWKLRTRLLETEKLKADFEALIAARGAAAFAEAGLDPKKLYSLDDQRLTATETAVVDVTIDGTGK